MELLDLLVGEFRSELRNVVAVAPTGELVPGEHECSNMQVRHRPERSLAFLLLRALLRLHAGKRLACETIQLTRRFLSDTRVGGLDRAACLDLFEFGFRVSAELFFTGRVRSDLLDEPDLLQPGIRGPPGDHERRLMPSFTCLPGRCRWIGGAVATGLMVFAEP